MGHIKTRAECDKLSVHAKIIECCAKEYSHVVVDKTEVRRTSYTIEKILMEKLIYVDIVNNNNKIHKTKDLKHEIFIMEHKINGYIYIYVYKCCNIN